MPVIGTPAAEAASHDCWTAMDTSYAAMDCESESESHDADLAPSERGPPTICPGVGRPGGRCVGCKDAAKTAAACSAKSGFSPGFGVDGGENVGEGDDGVGGSAVSRQTRWVVSLRPSAAARTSISSSAAESAVTVSEPSGWLR